ncbi:MAG: NAD(P)H-dependent oxidoreductase [Puniceicoccales bacterium]|jgi:nitroreductase|nr:NAD(P)H-dependent oxidoreductase [Puniceicoccales bacterium]
MALTPVLSESALLGTLKTRYATKLFDPQRKIPEPTWTALEETLVLSQSAFGAQPWKFLVVDSPKIRARLRPHTWDQPAVTDASKFVVFLARKATSSVDIAHYLARIAEVRGVTTQSLKGFNEVILETLSERALNGKLTDWAARQLYIALGQFTTAAALLGVDTCPIEGLEPKKYDEILQLGDTSFTTVLTVAAGYRLETDKYASLAKVRFPLAEVVQHV